MLSVRSLQNAETPEQKLQRYTKKRNKYLKLKAGLDGMYYASYCFDAAFIVAGLSFFISWTNPILAVCLFSGVILGGVFAVKSYRENKDLGKKKVKEILALEEQLNTRNQTIREKELELLKKGITIQFEREKEKNQLESPSAIVSGFVGLKTVGVLLFTYASGFSPLFVYFGAATMLSFLLGPAGATMLGLILFTALCCGIYLGVKHYRSEKSDKVFERNREQLEHELQAKAEYNDKLDARLKNSETVKQEENKESKRGNNEQKSSCHSGLRLFRAYDESLPQNNQDLYNWWMQASQLGYHQMRSDETQKLDKAIDHYSHALFYDAKAEMQKNSWIDQYLFKPYDPVKELKALDAAVKEWEEKRQYNSLRIPAVHQLKKYIEIECKKLKREEDLEKIEESKLQEEILRKYSPF